MKRVILMLIILAGCTPVDRVVGEWTDTMGFGSKLTFTGDGKVIFDLVKEKYEGRYERIDADSIKLIGEGSELNANITFKGELLYLIIEDEKDTIPFMRAK